MTRVRLLNRAAWNRIESIIVAWVGNRGVRLRRTAGCCEHVTTGGNEHAFDKTSSTKADLQGAAGRCVYAPCAVRRPCGSGKTVAYYGDVKGFLATPDNAGKAPALILMHDFGGLNNEMRKRARAFAAAGFVTLALDAFDGKTYASAQAARPVIGEQIKKSNHRVVFRNMRSGLSYLRSLPQVDGGRVAVAGWGYGAAWSFHMAVAGFDIGASVVYYSDSGAITAPAAYRLDKMEAPLIAHYPEKAADSDLDAVKELAKRVMARNKNTEVHIYKGASDRFDVEDGAAFDAPAARLAHQRTIDFLNRHL